MRTRLVILCVIAASVLLSVFLADGPIWPG
jgi:hypothetical protein